MTIATTLDFELDGYNFQAQRLDAFKQLHLSRKLAPLLPPLAPLIVRAAQTGVAGNVLELAELAEPFALALAQMKDDDAESVLTMTLLSVRVQTDAQKNVWMPLWVAGAKQAAVVELNDLARLLPIALRVINYNLGNFIGGLLTNRAEEASPETTGAPSRAARTG